MTPFLPRHVKDLVDEVIEAISWLVHGLLPRGVLALLVAYPKVGKSTLVYQLAVAVAQGKPFLGRQTSQGGVLIVVAEEMKEDAIRRLCHLGMNEQTDRIWLWTEGVKEAPKEREDIRQFVGENKIGLVIIDTFASYLMIADETDNSVVTLRMKPYVDLAHSTGTAILFVHHERKRSNAPGEDDTRAIRGGGAILGLADIALQLQRDGNGNKRRLKIVGRYQDIPHALSLSYQDDEYVCLGTPEEHARAVQEDKILAALGTTTPGCTVDEVAATVGMKPGAVRRILEDLHGVKKADRQGAGKKNDPYRYHRVSTLQAEVPATIPVPVVQPSPGLTDAELAALMKTPLPKAPENHGKPKSHHGKSVHGGSHAHA